MERVGRRVKALRRQSTRGAFRDGNLQRSIR
jgi:hypothetical protein